VQAVGGELELMVLIGGAEERAAIQWEKSMTLWKRGDERSFGNHVDRSSAPPISNMLT
jgi:hypothetical protein